MIYSAIAAIMADTKAVGKSEKNQSQGFMFRGIDNVMNELHSLFAKHKVFILPEVQDYDIREKITDKEWQGKKTTSILYYTRAKIRFTFMAEDGSSVTTTNVGEAMDSGDKGMNKAMSVALKYALLQMLLIPTEEDKDPDKDTPPPTRPKTIQEIRDGIDEVKNQPLATALDRIIASTSKNELATIWTEFQSLQGNPDFKSCLSTRKREVS